MSHLTNMQRPLNTSGFTPSDYPSRQVDTPDMAYVNWLWQKNDYICDGGSSALAGKDIAVVGAGISGLFAAYLLRRCGANVTLFEATNRIGGRLYTIQSSAAVKAEDDTYFEMGAMRFPPTSQLASYYMEKFGHNAICTWDYFPTPGDYDTWVCYQNAADKWSVHEGNAYPYADLDENDQNRQSFSIIHNGIADFLQNGITDAASQSVVDGLFDFWDLLKANASGSDVNTITDRWTQYISVFGALSWGDGIRKIFTGNNGQWNIPGGTAWSAEEFARFDALGIGTGGFRPLNSASFLEIARIIANGFEDDQRIFYPGIQTFADDFLTQIDDIKTGGDFTLITGAEVYDMDNQGTGSDSKVLKYKKSGDKSAKFDRVIFAASTPAIQKYFYFSEKGVQAALAPDTVSAINQLNIASSVKVVARVEYTTDLRSTPIFMADQYNYQIYVVTYNSKGKGGNINAACYITYSWNDDANRKGDYFTNGELTNQVSAAWDEIWNLALMSVRGSLEDDSSEAFSWINELQPRNDNSSDISGIAWQNLSFFNGAIKLAKPGQDRLQSNLYYDYLKCQTGSTDDTGFYVAGDCAGWMGGWMETAMITGLNAACAAAYSILGRTGVTDSNNYTCPLNVDASRYTYPG